MAFAESGKLSWSPRKEAWCCSRASPTFNSCPACHLHLGYLFRLGLGCKRTADPTAHTISSSAALRPQYPCHLLMNSFSYTHCRTWVASSSNFIIILEFVDSAGPGLSLAAAADCSDPGSSGSSCRAHFGVQFWPCGDVGRGTGVWNAAASSHSFQYRVHSQCWKQCSNLIYNGQ